MKAKTNLLDVIPFRSAHITTERKGDCIVIAFPRFKQKWMRRILLPKEMSADIQVKLEAHGTAVWELIDGKRTVGEIIEKLVDCFPEEVDYESRIVAYVYQLQKDKFIGFAAHR
ncbi:PqqD family protein [Bacteroides sp.]|uniref:PqqD family protein n=1 Tax=Bacteroides sp. TaxID=29523 RepID=UPI001B732E3B|nr:PqqD family protein [Bacteroides sp.]MBP6064895.1 PqqD family protein [Bacteroides sp.]MBP6935642.1 PqqD family protein [Bacteroides sp.]MBP8621496.1 PqqD family protein [Bacteroides sp.]MBP9508188.1 PqqD family protein [Bacteroides sp.]MBP9585849.1 PqqD family protein [Bacteroides sp.]